MSVSSSNTTKDESRKLVHGFRWYSRRENWAVANPIGFLKDEFGGAVELVWMKLTVAPASKWEGPHEMLEAYFKIIAPTKL